MRLTYGETVNVKRWSTWRAGIPQGDPLEWSLRGVAFAPADADNDPAGRRGHVVPTATLLFGYGDDLAPHDLLERLDGALHEVTGNVKRYRHPLTGWNAGATVAVTELVDSGPETVRVFSSQLEGNLYGDLTRAPGALGVEVPNVTIEPLASPEDSSDGQEANPRYRITGRGLDALDAFAEVEWPIDSGDRYDVIGVPVHWPWPPSAAYTQATLRRRS